MATPSPGARISTLWTRLSGLQGGPWLFSRLVGLMVPYTGTIGARVRSLAPGRCVVTLRDRRKVRNHLDSIHAVALANLGEMTSGLAMLTALPPGVRGIPTGLTVEFLKKARGPLVAESVPQVPAEVTEPVDVTIHAEIKDSSGTLVARTAVRWRLSPP